MLEMEDAERAEQRREVGVPGAFAAASELQFLADVLAEWGGSSLRRSEGSGTGIHSARPDPPAAQRLT